MHHRASRLQRDRLVRRHPAYGGPLEADGFSDPKHESGYSADDFPSLGFKKSAKPMGLIRDTKGIDDIEQNK